MEICLKNIECVRILCIYHPPDDSTYPLLSEQFSRFLELFLAEYSKSLIIADDFNLHLGDPRVSSYINPMKTENADHQWKHTGILRSLGRLFQKHILPVTDI